MKRYLQILYLTSYGNNVGGGEKSLLSLLSHLDRQRFQPLVVLLQRGGLVSELTHMGIPVEVIPLAKNTLDISHDKHNFAWKMSVNYAISIIPAIFKLHQLIIRNNIDLIHTHTLKAALIGGIAARLASVPLIWHDRTLMYHSTLHTLSAILAKHIIAISKAVQAKYKCSLLASKVSVIYNGADIEELIRLADASSFRKEFGIEQKCKLVGMISQLTPVKGHKCFLYGAAQIVKCIPRVKFIITGKVPQFVDPSYEVDIRNLTERLGLNEHVIFTGFREDIPRIIKELDVLVLPSKGEGFGRVFIEAMALGKPVITTNIGAAPEIIVDGKTGILVQPANPDSLAAAILKLLSNEKLTNQMGVEGYHRVKELFTAERNARETEKLYLKLAGSRNTRKLRFKQDFRDSCLQFEE